MTGVFLTASWRELVMVSWEVEAPVLEPLVPAGTTLDRWEGKLFVSLVGFRFLDTKVLGVPIPFHRDFDEVNLRFYVRREHEDELRRGVVFVKEIVPRAAVAWVARTVYNERYVSLPMRHAVTEREVRYEWKLPSGWCSLGAAREGEPSLPADGSEESFITEHYWGYAAQRDGGTMEYRVEHPQWRVWRGESRIAGELRSLYGGALGAIIETEPSSAFVADGSAVVVRRGRRL